MRREVVDVLLEAFSAISMAHRADADRANLLIVQAMRAARVSWVDLLGPPAKLEEIDRRAGTIISGPCLDAFTIPQLALLHLDRLPPRYLAAFAFWRHVPLDDRKRTGPALDLLWELHQKWRSRRRAERGATGIQLNSGSALQVLSGLPCGVKQKAGETQYEMIMRAIGPAEQPKPNQDQWHAAFVAAVLRPALW